jgi:hypothetical protein
MLKHRYGFEDIWEAAKKVKDSGSRAGKVEAYSENSVRIGD